MADPESVTALGDLVAERHGGLDILVNTAAIFRLAAFIEATPQMWDATYQVNLRGMFLTTQMAVRLMRAGAGEHRQLLLGGFPEAGPARPGALRRREGGRVGVRVMPHSRSSPRL